MAASKVSRRKAKPQTGRLMKAECPTCGMIVYLSRGAAIRHGMPSCSCGARMFFASLDVALEATPELAHEHPDFKAWTERQIQSALRDATRVGAERRRCGGCNAWITNGAELHSCGFHNDVRGNRNYGRWIAGASRVKAEMPF